MEANVKQLERLALDFTREGSEATQRLMRAQQGLAWGLVAYIKKDKLQGQVLHHRSGNLSTRITQQTSVSEGAIRSRIGVFAGVPYARIHEYGFDDFVQVKAHERTVFQVYGKQLKEPITVMVKSFPRHMHMPERSYLRTSLFEWQDKITKTLLAAAMPFQSGSPQNEP